MNKIIRPEKPKKEDLKKLYDICNRISKKKEHFYTKEQFEIKKKEMEELC